MQNTGILEKNTINQDGKSINMPVNHGKINHLGPTFSIYHNRNNATTADIDLYYDKAFHSIIIEQGLRATSEHTLLHE